MKKKNRRSRLTDRDLSFFEATDRYTIVTRDAIENLACFEGAGNHAVRTVLRRHLGARFIASQTLYGKKKCYYLTTRGLNAIGGGTGTGKHLSEQPKIRAFAALSFCLRDSIRRHLLTRAEFREFFPDLAAGVRRVFHYIDNEGPVKRLSFIRVDYGKTETIKLDQLIAYLRRDIRKMLLTPAAVPYVDAGQLQLTVLTAFQQKAERLERTIQDVELSLALPVRIHVIPELRELVAPISF